MASMSTGSRTRQQTAALEGAEYTETALLQAQEHLYAALRRPQPGRERRWAEAVGAELAVAIAALRNHRLEVEGDDGLFAELRRDAPWVAPRIRQATAQL